MRTIIAGSRGIEDYETVRAAVAACGWPITEVVSGTARGVDRLGERWADENRVPVMRFPAEWEKYGKAAGHIRNREMADYADALVAIWDGKSRGTAGMIEAAKERALSVYVYNVLSGFNTHNHERK